VFSKNNGLKHYQDQVWDCVEIFDAFSIIAIPQDLNAPANSLAVAAAKSQPCTHFPMHQVNMEVVLREMVPDDIDQWPLACVQ
jgi:hypothetical protein